jgi:hypothetical protein
MRPPGAGIDPDRDMGGGRVELLISSSTSDHHPDSKLRYIVKQGPFGPAMGI